MHMARIAPWPFPAEPEHQGLTTQPAWESFGRPDTGPAAQFGSSVTLGRQEQQRGYPAWDTVNSWIPI